jgi:DNA-binding IclR family transcriptional regulator
VSLQELARETGHSKSTVHRLLATLEGLEVVERDGQSRRYRLGRRMRELGRDNWAQIDLRQAAQPHMEALRDRTEETVTLHLIEGADHVVVEACESQQVIRYTLPLGQHTPLLRGATAKAILAFLPLEQRRRVLAVTRTETDHGPSDQELQHVRDVGYSFSLAERVPGAAAISGPIFDRMGRLYAALSVSGPSFRFNEARARRCAPALVEAVAEVSAAIGHAGRAERAGMGPRGGDDDG